jgi:RNA polymerase sigma factor (sigma-70 family)
LHDLDNIVDRCRHHDRLAQEALFEALSPAFLGLCVRYLGDRDEAEDVLQDSFVKIFMNISLYKKEGSFQGWARRIVVNTAITALRRKNRIRFDRLTETIEATDESDDENEFLSPQEMLACLDKLPVGYRVVINLFAIEEYSHKEIGERLGIRESTSRSQYARARLALRKIIVERSRLINESSTS